MPMTEREWLACADPQTMLEFLRGKVSDRKLRLFACACCRRLWHCEGGLAGQNEVDVAERFADGLVTRKALKRMSSKLGARGGYSSAWALNNALHAVMTIQAQEAAQDGSVFVGTYFYFHTIEGLKGTSVSDQQRAVGAKSAEREAQTLILQDVVGNPFQPVSLAPAWLAPSVRSLAQAAYDNRLLPSGQLDHTGLAVLADALEEAGCDNGDILSHLRGQGPHVRGCFVLDLLLGKE
jgi:hypothetical protein